METIYFYILFFAVSFNVTALVYVFLTALRSRFEKSIYARDLVDRYTEKFPDLKVTLGYRSWGGYDFVQDEIYLQHPWKFPTTLDFLCTFLHELGHWTSHPSRLYRPQTGMDCLTDEKEERVLEQIVYRSEEVVAELFLLFYCKHFYTVEEMKIIRDRVKAYLKLQNEGLQKIDHPLTFIQLLHLARLSKKAEKYIIETMKS
jgi:hypothetical protein